MMRPRIIALLAVGLMLSAGTSMAACLKVPAPSGVITSIYGWRYHPVYQKWRLHRGVDFRAAIGTSLVAANDGTVQVASSGGGGNEIRIVGKGTVTRYLHLTRAAVDPGTTVSTGQESAISGNTGEASAAPHLHFEVYVAGKAVDPEPLLCSGASRKDGADKVSGFPIKACDPDSGQCSSSSLPSSGSSGSSRQNSSSGSGGDTSAPPGPNISQFDDMSSAEILSTETSKRFINPDWYREQGTKTAVPLLIEYLHMEAVDLYVKLNVKQTRDRIETLMATRLARKNSNEMAQRLTRQRENAAKVGAGASQ